MPAFPKLSLVIGGVASGKSSFAERLIAASTRPPVYIATAQALDAEMAEKIKDHQARRGAQWRTLEAPLDLVAALSNVNPKEVVLIDCLTLWLSNLMTSKSDISVEIQHFTTALGQTIEPVVMVTNELGGGGVSENALARRFQREQGSLNQRMADIADLVVMVTAGLPHTLKGVLPGGMK